MNSYVRTGIAGLALMLSISGAQAEGTIKTALDGTFAPHAMPTLDGGVQGFNVDLVDEIGKLLDKKVDLTATQFSGLVPALQAGTYDFLAAPVTVTKERAQNLLFTEGFMATNYSFVVPAGTPAMTSLDDFKGKTIAVNKGSVYDSYLREKAGEYGWTVESYGTNSDAVAAVIAGRADANLSGSTVAAWAVKNNPKIMLSMEISTGKVWSLAFRKDDVENRNIVDRAIECLKLNGSMAKLSEKWFGVTPAKDAVIVTPTPGYGVPGFEGYAKDDHKASCDGFK